jgi:V/A-type H+/Na+-transporting ATPase subunit I
MIEDMRKLTLLLYHREKDPFLEKLRAAGVVHVVENPDAGSEQLAALRGQLQSSQRVLSELKRMKAQVKEPLAQRNDRTAADVVTEFDKLNVHRDAVTQRLAALRKERAALAPWGEFSPERLQELAERGVTVRFLETSARHFSSLDLRDCAYEVISREGSSVRFVVVEHGAKCDVGVEEVALPEGPLSATDKAIAEAEQQEAEAIRALNALCAYVGVLEKDVRTTSGQAHYQSVRESMAEGAGGKVLSLTGWAPRRKLDAVTSVLDSFSAWYVIEAPGKDDAIPVILHNGPFARLFEPITKLFQLPSYFELDPTFAIAPFFALFFGNCLGDTGYGLILIALAIVGLAMLRGSLRLVAGLVLVLGVATTIMGTLNSGTFFGLTVTDHPGNAFFRMLSKAVIIRDDGGVISPFNFALLLGVIQMNFGMSLNIYNNIYFRSFRDALPGIGRLLLVDSCIVLFLTYSQGVEALKPLAPFATVGSVLGVLALVYVAFFTDTDKYLDIRFVNLVLKLYFVLSGAVGDVLSYIRLFALGLSSGILGYVVNVIASQLTGIPYIGWLLFIVFLVVGHGGNLLLSMLGSFVHPLRLTFVEFYGNLAFTGGGIEYRPLKDPTEGSGS